MYAFYLSAAHKSSGKTTLSIGLSAALTRRGLRVQAFKKGPDYIDPLWMAQASGRPCYNLDFNTQSHAEIRTLFELHLPGRDVAIVEGNKGLFDGVDPLGSDCNAAMARLLNLPVVLVLDVQGVTRGIAPLLLGYTQFEPRVEIAGVIFNKVAGDRHESKLRQVVEHYTDLPVLGAVRNSRDLRIEERHLGLVPSNELGGGEGFIDRLAGAVTEQVDLDRVAAIGPREVSLLTEGLQRVEPDVTVAVARDHAFGFYYADDLEALERAGARLVIFSPLRDPTMPEADGLFIGGGFPETHMEGLAANRPMRESIGRFIRGGGAAYAECGGLMYLCRELRWQGKVAPMAGVIEADAVMHERPQGRGYVKMWEQDSHPWPGGDGGVELPVHEFHYSRLENLAPGYPMAYRLSRGEGMGNQRDGLVYQNLLAGYAHQRHVAGNPWAERFVAFIRQCRDAAKSN